MWKLGMREDGLAEADEDGLGEGGIVGFVEAVGERGIAGWAFRAGDVAPLRLILEIDGEVAAMVVCDREREDVVARREDVRARCRHAPLLGFRVPVPPALFDGQSHRFALFAEDGVPSGLAGLGRREGWDVFSFAPGVVLGRVEPGGVGAPVFGWALLYDRRSGEKRARNEIEVVGAGGASVRFVADQARPDVAAAQSCDPACGFRFVPPAALFDGGPASLHFYVLPERIELPRSPVTVEPPEVSPAELVGGAFDAAYYLHMHLDVAARGVDPLRHYLEHGWKEGRRPAAWFDPAFYLDANPDVRASGRDPFWHFLAVGRREGRAPAQPGGWARGIVEGLVAPEERMRGHPRAEAVIRLGVTGLAARVAAACARARGLVVSVSHDNYRQAVGGVQLFLGIEERGFAERGFAYLHVSPVDPALALAGPAARGLLRVVLDGVVLGATVAADLAEVLRGVGGGEGFSRVFVVHSVFGHHPEALAALWAALGAGRNYFWVHDYSSLCTGYNLLRDDVAFCGAPAADSNACAVCVYGAGRERHQARMSALFETVPFTVVAPSRAALAVWQAGSVLPHVDAVVHPHCRFEATGVRERVDGAGERPVRVAFVGYPIVQKGFFAFSELVDRVGRRAEYRFFHFVGGKIPPPVRGWVTQVAVRASAQDRDATVSALVAGDIDLVLVLSTWPETFSYVSFEALAAGADVVALAGSGNVADMVTASGRGVVLADAAALFAWFEGGEAVAYVRRRAAAGFTGGALMHEGTTASLMGVA